MKLEPGPNSGVRGSLVVGDGTRLAVEISGQGQGENGQKWPSLGALLSIRDAWTVTMTSIYLKTCDKLVTWLSAHLWLSLKKATAVAWLTP